MLLEFAILSKNSCSWYVLVSQYGFLLQTFILNATMSLHNRSHFKWLWFVSWYWVGKNPGPQYTRYGLSKQNLIQRFRHRRIVFVKSKNHRLIKWLNKVHITTPLRNIISCFGNPGTVDKEYVNDFTLLNSFCKQKEKKYLWSTICARINLEYFALGLYLLNLYAMIHVNSLF